MTRCETPSSRSWNRAKTPSWARARSATNRSDMAFSAWKARRGSATPSQPGVSVLAAEEIAHRIGGLFPPLGSGLAVDVEGDDVEGLGVELGLPEARATVVD